MRKVWNKTKKNSVLCGAAFALMLTAASASPAWAGEWNESETGDWSYEEDGTLLTGWQKLDGVWYEFDENGLWNASPALTGESVCYLLENAVNRAGWYRNEESEMVYKVDSIGQHTITVSIMLETAPEQYSSTLATFDVSRREGTAKCQSTKEVLQLR